jgi:dienelactone hydrolase
MNAFLRSVVSLGLCWAILHTTAAPGRCAEPTAGETWKAIAPFFRPPETLAGDLGRYKSPLNFDDGRRVKTADDWQQRRREILAFWRSAIGAWPPLIERPAMEEKETTRREGFRQEKVGLQVAADLRVDGYLLLPDGEGPLPAVLVVYYDAETGAGLVPEKKHRDFGYQLARRGFVALSIGWPRRYTDEMSPRMQPLSSLAYIAANCYNALAALPEVDPQRIGVVGHSFGGKWAMFAACLYEKFACAAWSDPGIVFDERRPNVNYWEPWYLGWEAGRARTPGVPTDENPSTGAYKRLFEGGHDLHGLHALMAPRPFLVSGGAEDRPERWKALNHTVAVNRLLGYENRVAMTNRPAHSPTRESNEQLYLFFEHFLKHEQAGN